MAPDGTHSLSFESLDEHSVEEGLQSSDVLECGGLAQVSVMIRFVTVEVEVRLVGSHVMPCLPQTHHCD